MSGESVEDLRLKIADLVEESEGLRLALASAEDAKLNNHCAGLHVRIEELHRRMTTGFEWDIIDCACCGAEMIKQIPDNNLGNHAMELCGQCAWEVAKDHPTPTPADAERADDYQRNEHA